MKNRARTLTVLLALIMVLLPTVAEADFMDDITNVETMYRLRENTDYVQLDKFVADYIEANQPEATDYVYKLKEVFDTNREALDSITEVVDDFDGSRSFTFDGVALFDDGYCVIPQYNKERDLFVELGFIADDWVFFDRIEISVDGEIVCDCDFDYDETITDVLEGTGNVKEYTWVYPYFFDEYIADIHNGEKVAIRFSNSKDNKKYQHVLADEEKAALYHCWQVFNMRGAIYDVYADYLASPQYQALLESTEPFVCDNGFPMYPSGSKSRFMAEAKTELDEAIFNGTEREQEKLKGTVYIVTGALIAYGYDGPELRVGDFKIDIIDNEYTREDGADYTEPAEGETVNFILVYDHSSSLGGAASFYLGAKESKVLDIRTR